MPRSPFALLLTSLLLVSVPALAQSGTGGSGWNRSWSVYSGETVGAGTTAIAGELGWPGIDASVIHGVTNNVDVGGKFTFNYGEEGIVTNIVPGVKLQGIAKVKLLDTGHVKLGITFSPGLLFYFFGSQYCDFYGCYQTAGTQAGLILPVDFNVGIPLGSAVMVNFGLSVPLWVTFGYSDLIIPVLIGFGFEYFIDSHLAFTFNLRVGPSIDTFRNVAVFDLNALAGLAVRF